MPQVQAMPRLLTVDELSEFLGVPVATIYRWRVTGGGPRGIRVGRFVRYRPRDVESWLEERSAPVAVVGP